MTYWKFGPDLIIDSFVLFNKNLLDMATYTASMMNNNFHITNKPKLLFK